MCARISIFRADILCSSGMSTGSTLPKAIFAVDPQTPARMLFCEEGLWTVVPLSVAAQLSRQPHVRLRLQMTSSPSPRSTYYITHKYPRDNCKAVLPMVKDLPQRYASAYPLDV